MEICYTFANREIDLAPAIEDSTSGFCLSDFLPFSSLQLVQNLLQLVLPVVPKASIWSACYRLICEVSYMHSSSIYVLDRWSISSVKVCLSWKSKAKSKSSFWFCLWFWTSTVSKPWIHLVCWTPTPDLRSQVHPRLTSVFVMKWKQIYIGNQRSYLYFNYIINALFIHITVFS